MFKSSFKGNIKDRYKFENKLASGGFGLVYLAHDRKSGERYAIKAIQKKKVEDFQTFINEINILQQLVSNFNESRIITNLYLF
jgi:serine/threonine protein kinase